MKWELVGDLSGDFYLQIASETFYIFTKFAFKELINHIYHGKELNRLRATACYKFKEILEKYFENLLTPTPEELTLVDIEFGDGSADAYLQLLEETKKILD